MTSLKDSATQYITLKKQGSTPTATPATDEILLYSDEATVKLKLDSALVIDLQTTVGGAPSNATYITQTANGTLTNEQALSSLSTGLVKVTTGTGVLSTAVGGTDYANASHNHNASDINAGQVSLTRGGTGVDASAFTGLLKIASGSTTELKCNFSASAAPTANDDSGDGYIVGSLWFDISNDRAYICLDNTLTAAIWLLLTLTNSLVGNTIQMAALRTITNSSDTGTQGEVCFDANYVYVCTAANTWKRAALSTW